MDNFRVIYSILRYLEKALDYDNRDLERISAKTLGISEQRWKKLMLMLSEAGFINVECTKEKVAGRVVGTVISDIRITLRGLEYLQENPMMKKFEMPSKKTGVKNIKRPTSPPAPPPPAQDTRKWGPLQVHIFTDH